MKRMKVSELVFDFDFYPRAQIDSQHVAYLEDVMKAGHALPPIVIDKASKRVVDGFHRCRAALKMYGKDAEIEVIEKAYRNDRELFLDAVRYNSGHGRTLAMYDRAHCAILAARLEIDDAALAGALQVTTDRLAELRADRSATSGGKLVPIKRTIAHMAGKKLTPRQAEANKKFSGMEQTFYVNQVILLLENDLVNTENGPLMERLGVLAGLLRKVVKTRAA
jgi:hypothetical protein